MHAAWTGNDLNRLIEFYTVNVYYSNPANPESLKGNDEILPYFLRLLTRNSDWKWESEEIIPALNGFALKWRAVIPSSNGIVREKGLEIVEIRIGRIARNKVYFDSLALRDPHN